MCNEIKKRKEYIANKKNNIIYWVQRRVRQLEKNGEWSGWKNYKKFLIKRERDEFLEEFLKTFNTQEQLRPSQKFKVGTMLSESQRKNKIKKEGNYLLLYREFDKYLNKITKWKIYSRHETPEKRQKYWEKLPAEKKQGKLWSMKTKVTQVQ